MPIRKVEGRYNNGNPHYVQRFKDDKKVGVWKEWFYDEHLKEACRYRDGVLHGVHKSWHPNHQLKMVANFKAGKHHGRWQEWDSLGNLTFDADYEEGKKGEVRLNDRMDK